MAKLHARGRTELFRLAKHHEGHQPTDVSASSAPGYTVFYVFMSDGAILTQSQRDGSVKGRYNALPMKGRKQDDMEKLLLSKGYRRV